MMVLVRSLRNWVRGRGSCSGSQSASGSRWIFSKRLAGLLAAPRVGGDDGLDAIEQLSFIGRGWQVVGRWFLGQPGGGKAGTESRETVGVRGACSRFR